MGAKAEISWKGHREDGTKREVYAQHIGTRWVFFEREKRYDEWKTVAQPALEDWLELLDAVDRRVNRRLQRPEESVRLRKNIRELFPDAEIP